jgi:UDP-N-acetylglucosamine transferase subunit ALG13
VILFTIGTSEPFDRLISVADAVAESTGEAVVVQTGRSRRRLDVAQSVPFLTYDELAELISSSRVVVAHAGAGSVLLCLLHGKVPLVVPRLRRFGEVIDDHQLIFARRMHDLGLVRLVENPEDIVTLVDGVTPAPMAVVAASNPLTATLRANLEQSLTRSVRSD